MAKAGIRPSCVVMTKFPRYQHFDQRRYARAAMRFRQWEFLATCVVFGLIALFAFARGDRLYGLLQLVFVGILAVAGIRLRVSSPR